MPQYTIERLPTGVEGFDRLIAGGIPKGFMVAAVGEPGTGKTVFAIHFAWEGLRREEKVIYGTTEESRESIVKQAAMFGFDFRRAIRENKLVIIDALMRGYDDPWSLNELEIDALVEKVIEAKRFLGYGEARLVIDSMSAFWLDKPVMARRYSYQLKRTLYKWGFTMLVTSQYAITTEKGYGFGVEHVADGIIRFRRMVIDGVLRRFVLIEKMRQTPHDLRVWEMAIEDGKGMKLLHTATGLDRQTLMVPTGLIEKLVRAEVEKILGKRF